MEYIERRIWVLPDLSDIYHGKLQIFNDAHLQ